MAQANRRIALLGVLAVAGGCVSDRLDTRSPGASGPGARASIDDLWDLAPADAVSGVVLRDGVLARALALVADDTRSAARTTLHDLVRDRSKLPFDPLDAQAWASAGIDPARGAAVFAFTSVERGVVLVLPVVDRDKFRRAFGFTTRFTSGRNVDELPRDLLCDDLAGRYLCARKLAEIEGAIVPHPSALAEAARAASEPADLEAYATRDDPDVVKDNKRPDAPGTIASTAGTLRLRADGAELHLVARGAFATPEARGLYAAVPPDALAPALRGAASFGRVHLEPGAFFAKRRVDDELREELLDQLTGDARVLAGRSGFASAAVVAPLGDAARAEAFLKRRCAAEAAKPDTRVLGDFHVEAHGCSAVVDLHKFTIPLSFPTIPLRSEVVAGELRFTVGSAATEPAGAGFGPPEGASARGALEGPSTAVFVGHDLTLGPEIGGGEFVRRAVPLVGGRAGDAIEAWNYFAAHIFEGVARARVTDELAELTVDLTNFGADPDDARAAYAGALEARFAGDEAKYRVALDAIRDRFPRTRAGRRAAEVRRGQPMLGAGAALLAVLGLAAYQDDAKKK